MAEWEGFEPSLESVSYTHLDVYKRQLQIIKRDQDADPKVNVVAELLEDERRLLSFIRPGQAFAFDFVP